jgi:hypothetical protein
MIFKDEENGAKLGDYVKTNRHGHTGRICAKHHSFRDTGENEGWFKMQVPALPESARNQSWYSILVHDGGLVLVPESNIVEMLEPFELKNVWESYYFNV